MAHICKMNQEREFVSQVKAVGFVSCAEMDGEGSRKGRTYYCFHMRDGSQRFWTNLSDWALRELGLIEKTEDRDIIYHRKCVGGRVVVE